MPPRIALPNLQHAIGALSEKTNECVDICKAALYKQLFALDLAKSAADMDAPGWRLHPLSGKYKGHWSVAVSGNWRIVFAFDGADAVLVDYLDYH